jgi:hypothetical protein
MNDVMQGAQGDDDIAYRTQLPDRAYQKLLSQRLEEERL